MTSINSLGLRLLLALTMPALAACGGPQVTTTQPLADAADAPYRNILVIFLAESFDSRRYLETEIVKALEERGSKAVRSTSMMDSRTPATRETFLEMVEKIEADAVLVTQIASLQSTAEVVNMNPQATYNFRPTWYYNVWSVDLQEYEEPEAMDFEHELALATQLFSVKAKDVVWAIESQDKITQLFNASRDYSIYVDEAEAIVSSIAKAGLLEK